MSQNIAHALSIASGAQKSVLDGLRAPMTEAMGLAGAAIGLETFVYGDVLESGASMGHACVNCGGSFEKCYRNISKPACCGACKNTSTHGQRTIAHMMTAGDVPKPIVTLIAMASALGEIAFPTLKEQAATALAEFANDTEPHSASAHKVADLLRQTLESKEQ